jgi:hypothetical protein
MRRSLKRKRKHNRLVQTGNAGGRRRTVERWQRNKFSGGVVLACTREAPQAHSLEAVMGL